MRIRKRRALAVILIFGAINCIGYMWIASLVSPAMGANEVSTAVPSAVKTSAPSSAGAAFFESRIRPVLTDQCYKCHSTSAKKPGGELFLDTRQGMRRGGDLGPAVVPGNVADSVLIQAILYTDPLLKMPPTGKLPDAVISDMQTWIKMGAPDTRDGAAGVVAHTYDTEKSKKWWAFAQPIRPAPAKVADAAWPHGQIDGYVLAALEAKNIKPVADADKATLIRRVSFDLIGLPPSVEDVDAFLRDDKADAFEKVVDKLLASPQFGERWGRHWLDVARYAESTGKDVNITFPDAWRYRDYVIASFNQDKPYDQFIKEQLAGDLLPALTPKKRAEQLIATGFLAVGPKGLEEKEARQFALDMADEQVATTSQAFMGLTVQCARCHDHKFDPIMQKDYYGMAGIFLSSNTKFGTVPGPRNDDPSELIELPAAANEPTAIGPLSAPDRAALTKELADATTALNELLAQRGRDAPKGLAQEIKQANGRKAHAENQLNNYDAAGRPKAFCMGAEDRPPTMGPIMPMGPMDARRGVLVRQVSGFETIKDSPLFFRGDVTQPQARVPRAMPAFLASSGAPTISAETSGRRELANWIASPRNPLTARVMANRLWYWLMGQGIVNSVDNFGTMGEAPSNQQLLDHLAWRLIDNGWSVKKTIREIVLSHAYQLSSTNDPDNYTIDPQNALVWRHSPRRLDAECIRDAMLMASGELDLKAPTGSLVATAGDGAIGTGPPYMRINEGLFINAAGSYRGIYLPAVRDLEPDALGVFDYPDTNNVNGVRESTNVPSQALYLTNSDFVQYQARLMARRVVASYPGAINQPGVLEARVTFAFRTIFGRSPTDTEQKAAADYFARVISDGALPVERWTDFCLALYNTAEFRMLK